MDQYTQLYAWINYALGNEPFTIDTFRSTFPSSQAPKVIFDLVKDGYLERISRGEYQAVEPQHLIENVIDRSYSAQSIIGNAEKDYAFTNSTAVMIWTSGYYWTGFTRGFRPLHIKVLSQDLPYWKSFFKESGAQFSLIDENRTLFGFVYILHPDNAFEAVERDKKKVVPLEEVVKYCLEREEIFQPALEYLDEKFGIGYQSRVSIET